MAVDRTLLIPSLGALGFFAISVFLFLRIREIERPQNSFLPALKVGKYSYQLRHQGRCVGGVETELREDPGLVFTVRGSLRVGVQQDVVPVKFFIGAFFNSLSQLVSSNFEIEARGQSALIATSQPNPISVKIAVNREGSTLPLREFDVPGPIELLARGEQSYQVKFSGLQENIQRLLSQLSQIREMPKADFPEGGLMTFSAGNSDGFCGEGEERSGRLAFPIDAALSQLPFFEQAVGLGAVPSLNEFLSQKK